jgi:hypothetical protein
VSVETLQVKVRRVNGYFSVKAPPPITPANARILRAIIEIAERERRGAKWREIVEEVDRGMGTVQDHVKALIEKGYATKGGEYVGIRALLNPDGTPYMPRAAYPATMAATANGGSVTADEPPRVEWRAEGGERIHGIIVASPPQELAELNALDAGVSLLVVAARSEEYGLEPGDLVAVEDRPPRDDEPATPRGRAIVKMYRRVRP